MDSVDVYHNIFPTISTEDRRKEDIGDSDQEKKVMIAEPWGEEKGIFLA